MSGLITMYISNEGEQHLASYAVITENDESAWDDQTGRLYHYPNRYLKHLEQGTLAVYYKGRIKDKTYADQRLSNAPHYFGLATIGASYPDQSSPKNDYFAVIEGFQAFKAPVLAKQDGQYLEQIPPNRATNYWRDGVRPITQAVYNRIVRMAQTGGIAPTTHPTNDLNQGQPAAMESEEEGQPNQRYVTIYERNPKLRAEAIRIHGTTCKACGFNFGKAYGDYAEGFIHVHHLKPMSTNKGPTTVTPKTDLVPVCANCHAVIHRRRDMTLSIEELRSMMK